MNNELFVVVDTLLSLRVTLCVFFQCSKEVQVPTKPQAGVQSGAGRTDGQVSVLGSVLL